MSCEGSKCDLGKGKKKIVMLTQEGCDNCEEARQYLKSKGKLRNVQEQNLSSMPDTDYEKLVKKFPLIEQGTPTFIVDDKKQCDLFEKDGKPTLACTDDTTEEL